MNTNTKDIYEVTYIVKCRVWNADTKEDAHKLAVLFKEKFSKGFSADYTSKGCIENFNSRIKDIRPITLKRPYQCEWKPSNLIEKIY